VAQVFTAGERALADPTLALPLDMGCWGGMTHNLLQNDRVWGGRGED